MNRLDMLTASTEATTAWRAVQAGWKADMAKPVQIDFQDLSSDLYTSLSEPQRTVYEDTARFKYLMAGRRFGKTYLAITRLLTWALSTQNGLFYYVTATYRMAKQIAWVDLKRMIPPLALASKNEQELSVELMSGRTLGRWFYALPYQISRGQRGSSLHQQERTGLLMP
jgi:hypothetical protein